MSVGQFPILLRNPTFHCHVHKSPPIVPILILANPVHTLPPNFFKTRQQSAILIRGLIPSYFLTITLYEIPLFTTRATSPASNIIFHNTYMARHTNNEVFSSLVHQSKAGVGSLIVKVSKLQLRHTALPVTLLRTSDHLVAEAANCTTNTRGVHPWSQRDSNPHYQQPCGCRPTL
jgi:hypothetical protein